MLVEIVDFWWFCFLSYAVLGTAFQLLGYLTMLGDDYPERISTPKLRTEFKKNIKFSLVCLAVNFVFLLVCYFN